MTILLSDHILSASGFSADENFRKVEQGVSGLTFFDRGYAGLPEPFVASAIADAALDKAFYALPRAAERRYTKLEKAVILSVAGALKNTPVDPAGERVLFILSTTKGNVFLLDPAEREGYEPEQVYL
ncbi:MAG: 3-oxoacyl-ACP synthase, partial [Tannerella sp.]|nr:3-oxoacyl-ACP synthase [Tannerella sp.]